MFNKKLFALYRLCECIIWVKSFKTTENGYARFRQYAVEGILAIDDFELEKFKS